MQRVRKSPLLLTTDQKRILWHIRTQGPMPRSRLADELGMHNAAITRLARELINLGCLDELDVQATQRGRPLVPLGLSGRVGYAAGAMAHPGWLELVLVDFAGQVLVRHAEPFDSPDPRAFIERISEKLQALAGRTSLIGSRFLGLGVAVPGFVPAAHPRRRWTTQWLAGWRDIDLPDFFEDCLGLPVWTENESTLAGLADFHDHGLARDFSSALSLFVGHGVGGCIVSRRDILSGEFGNAGDVGQLFPDLDKPRPSGIDLVREINAAGGNLRSLHEVADGLEVHAAVIDAWVERATEQLLTLVYSGFAWIDPGAILVTGSIPQPILEKIGARARLAPWPSARARPPIHVTKLGSWAIPIGAALLPMHDLIVIRA
ncbi:ROK family transcriptional regulator [Caulobacter sp. RHG1]|uniref:ROK family transcriptional regulator n=1 Tax=Caulobacter sp. (strain RHG1) TaxID=2545762 RepID=UPI0019D5EE73|nr:ROK family transcriptional regulator [Caulobacter sp. RHG1]